MNARSKWDWSVAAQTVLILGSSFLAAAVVVAQLWIRIAA